MRWIERRNADPDWAKPANLMLRRNRAAVPGMRFTRALVIDERKPLPLGVLEIERQATVLLGDFAHQDIRRPQPRRPVVERRRASHAKIRSRDRWRAAPLRRNRPVKKGQIAAGAPDRIGVEKVVGAHIILVDASLDQTHP